MDMMSKLRADRAFVMREVGYWGAAMSVEDM